VDYALVQHLSCHPERGRQFATRIAGGVEGSL
jgi:hypothetical protein